jgi:hemerythrin-like domain-containing protein
MSRRTAGKGKARARADAAESFMRLLREDHAGLSRVLREVDAQQTMLQSSPESARPVLNEAMRYLLVYQHSVHHPREDRLFARIRAREPGLYRNMSRLVREHRSGQQRTEQLAGELSRATPAQLRGKTGLRLANQLQQYVRHTRAHMRREEAVFYAGCERVLRASDWVVLMDGTEQKDPAGDLSRLAARYPNLAARLSQAERHVTGPGETIERDRTLKHRVEWVIERCAGLAHEALDVAKANLEELGQVRTPRALVRTAGSVGTRSNRFVVSVLTRPFRRSTTPARGRGPRRDVDSRR